MWMAYYQSPEPPSNFWQWLIQALVAAMGLVGLVLGLGAGRQ
jgi:hypothetical protein